MQQEFRLSSDPHASKCRTELRLMSGTSGTKARDSTRGNKAPLSVLANPFQFTQYTNQSRKALPDYALKLVLKLFISALKG